MIATKLLNMKVILPIDIWNINDLSNIKNLGLKKLILINNTKEIKNEPQYFYKREH